MGIPFLYPAISYGGAARAAYELAGTLHEMGHQITVLTTDVWDRQSRYRKNGFHAPFEIIRVPNLSNKIAYHWQFYTPLGILKHAERLLSQSDVLHLHTFRNLLNDLLARAAVKQKIPYVLSGHGTIPRIERFHFIKQAYDYLIGRWQLENASGYVAVSPAERRNMRQFGLSAGKIRVIPNGVGSIEEANPGAFRERWRIDPDEQIVLFLGKITPRKGLQHLVRAFAQVRNRARLVIAGNDMGYGGRIRALISQLHLEQRTLWTGVLNDQQKFAAFADADLTVYPSANEVFGLVPLESILAGTPVIVCADHGCGQVIRRTGGGDLVPWADVQALTHSIQSRLQRGKDEVELLRAQDRIRLHFNWPMVARATLRFYKKAIRLRK